MQDGALPIFWQGHRVGQIDAPEFDMFHLYGRWVAETSEPAAQFLAAVAAITSESEDGIWVTIGAGLPELRGTVEFLGSEPPFPDTEIEITVRP
jgi:hypothetical protein